MTEVPQAFNWVIARSKCSLETVFFALGEVIDSDVTAMRAAFEGRGPDRFEVNRPTGNKIIVARQRNLGGMWETRAVVFERTIDAIVARTSEQESKTIFTATPVVLPTAPEGRCLLAVGNQPLELWQISQRALEPLFFGS